ncbi:hypothetical protein XELAEV_18010172mg [Xenopus laevis]|uniref:Uncharacterized protein n=1 Tax=Xenopus laevis TaxID=8355 RepID=A0A974DU10_XENLA|nr:hypothetical protein XELAEV_18010172mg [Xenopus laevis]
MACPALLMIIPPNDYPSMSPLVPNTLPGFFVILANSISSIILPLPGTFSLHCIHLFSPLASSPPHALLCLLKPTC